MQVEAAPITPATPVETQPIDALILEAPFAAAVLNRDLQYLVANTQWNNLFNLGAASVVGRAQEDVLPGVASSWVSLQRRALAGEKLTVEGQAATDAGKLIWAKMVPWYANGDGLPTGVIVYARESDAKVQETASERHRQLAEVAITNLPAVLAMFDRDGVFTLSEGSGLAALGLKPGQVVGLSLFDVYKDVPQIVQSCKRCLAGETLHELVYVGPLVFDSYYIPITTPQGVVDGGIVISTNVTEAKATEKALLESSRKFDVALEGGKLGLWDWNLLTNDVIYSDRWVTMLGYEPGDLAGRFETFASLVHPEDMDRVVGLVNDHLAGKTDDYSVEMRLKRKGAGYHWVLASGKIFDRTEDGKPARMVGIHVDVDGHRRAEASLEEANQKFDVALEGAKLGVWDWNLLTNDVIFSDRWVTMLGYEPGELAGRFETFASLVHSDDTERVVGLVNDHLGGKTPEYTVEMRLKTKTGDYKWILASGKIFDRTADGKPARMVGIHLDINERKTAERERELLIRQLRETSRFKDEFFAVMSHELRTPLNAMIGLLGIVLMGGNLNERDTMMVTRARANSDRLLSLINNILDISRIEAGRYQLVTGEVNLRDLVEKTRSSVSVLAEQKKLDLETIVDVNLPETIEADEDALTKIITNLLSNAIKFTNEGSVSLRVTRQDDQMVFVVTDTGIGIPTHMHEIIFESFRQVDATSTRAQGGSGLGLSIVQNLCSAMNGSIKVASEVGKGTTFTVTLPLNVNIGQAVTL